MVFSYYGTILMITRIFTDTNDSSNQTGHATFNYEAITISASSEIIGLTIAILAVNRIGRISPAVSSFLMGGTFAVVLAFSASSKPIWFLTVIAFGARCVEMAGSSILWISTAEILPTELRSTGHGSSNAIGRIGGILAPFLIQSNISLLTVSVCMFGIHSVTALGMSLLPETKNLEVGEISLHGHETAEVCANERTSVLQNKTVLTYSTVR
uniref:Major facilitator superfamily (MFS) profile domain-containing protein n=2 Tax=Proboscia inermis TaxID=420281 RepID=A0A7S0G731_9STRA|mmetsp:Transcript_13772/g.13937  ORF Transcript_13772/g.13937 Transcript_13772/m.13937 type:complete len:212 (+) Transcript_13772:111-746(+)